ncbi:MAG: hypothetical protein F6K11_21655 [Leptolyngbya sp. SIO3F4]|nr:hypothetical protein [Leptolyngbya sp. SIO3F4]
MQEQVLRNLLFSLEPKGVLFLGESESLGYLKEEFNPLDSNGIFMRNYEMSNYRYCRKD